MFGVVSLLDDQHYRLVEALWQEMERRFDVRGIYDTPYPHVSYHVAERYDLVPLETILTQFASQISPFTITAAGLALFTGQEPIVYIPVARSPTLAALHQRIWPQVEPVSEGSVAYYAPLVWFPHITLGQGDITTEKLADIVQWLGVRPLSWQIRIDNFAILGSEASPHVLHKRFELGGSQVDD